MQNFHEARESFVRSADQTEWPGGGRCLVAWKLSRSRRGLLHKFVRKSGAAGRVAGWIVDAPRRKRRKHRTNMFLSCSAAHSWLAIVFPSLLFRAVEPSAPATARRGGSGLLACWMQSCRHVSGFGSDSRGGLPALVQPVVDAIVSSLWSRATGDSQVACVSNPNSDGAMPCRRRCLWPAFVALCWVDEGWHPNWNGIRSPSATASLVTAARPYGASVGPEGLWMRWTLTGLGDIRVLGPDPNGFLIGRSR